MPQNIDDFTRGCALILAKLYSHFPKRVQLDVASLDTHEDLHEDLVPENGVRRRERIEVYGATVDFLREEGYLRFGEASPDKTLFTRAVLTSKGLAALNRTPDLMAAPRKTAGDLLLDLGKDLALHSASEVLKRAVGVILGG